MRDDHHPALYGTAMHDKDQTGFCITVWRDGGDNDRGFCVPS
jgi:hypothetical protein